MTATCDLLTNLNEQQRQAVTHVQGPLLILAGPGSGKTRVISHRIAYLISQGIPARTIVALTFTNKAADELRNRTVRLVGSGQMWTGTFHRFCSRILRIYPQLVGLNANFTIYDTGDSRKLLKQAIDNAEVRLQHHSPDSIQTRISTLKSSGVTQEEYQPAAGDYLGAIVARVYPEYQKLLLAANGVDFDDLLLYCVDLLRNNPELRESLDSQYHYMMVDEYQDTNLAQYQLIRLLNHDVRNLAVTGDPDQSIYGWRGANLNNILEFERDYPNLTIVRLEQNYRSTKAILQVADHLIRFNKRRKPKSLVTDNDLGPRVRLIAYPTVQDEAAHIVDTISLAIDQGVRRPRDFAVLYRTNRLSRSLEHALRAAGIPYQILKALEFYQRREVKDVLAYLHLLNNPSDNVALERIINAPPRKIGKVTVTKIRQDAQRQRISMLDAARQSGLNENISKSVATKVAAFVAMFDRIAEADDGTVESLMKAVIRETGYREWLTDDGSEEGHERAANVDELVVAAQEFDNQHPQDGGLERYLEQAALVSDTDAWQSEADYVSLMSLHAAKGLEFPCVFIVGLEDGILPHERSRNEQDQLEEERRLLFVGITRARQELQLSRCLSRFRKGGFWPCIPSSFLMEMPRDEMEVIGPRSNNRNLDEQPDIVPFSVDPWMHGGVDEGYDPDEFDYRGMEDDDEFDVGSSIRETKFVDRQARQSDIDAIQSQNSDFDGDRSRESKAAYRTGDRSAKFPRLMTGSELAHRQEHAGFCNHASMYREGTTVEHEEYGTGIIESISGQNLKQTATVAFEYHGRKRFRLAWCNLKIVDE